MTDQPDEQHGSQEQSGGDDRDRRVVRGKPNRAAVRSLENLRPAWLEAQFAVARGLFQMHENAAFLFESAASIPELASRMGFDGENAHRSLWLGYALAGLPGLEDALRAQAVALPSAYVLGPIFMDPDLQKDDDDWLDLAKFKRLRDLRRIVRERIEEVYGKPEKKIRIHADVRAETKDLLADARKIASARAHAFLTLGDTLDVIARSYILETDVTYKLPRERRLPDTAEIPWSRQVPAEVDRAILKRSGGICEFGCCEHQGVELCHIRPHAKGSGREKEDLVLGCHTHHKLLDKKIIRFASWTQEGTPLFQDTKSNKFLLPKPLPEERGKLKVPDWLVQALAPRAGRVMRRLLKKQAEDEAKEKAEKQEEAARKSKAKTKPDDARGGDSQDPGPPDSEARPPLPP